MAQAVVIRTDLFSPAELRWWAQRERDRRAARRMLAVASALEGLLSRGNQDGCERQSGW